MISESEILLIEKEATRKCLKDLLHVIKNNYSKVLEREPKSRNIYDYGCCYGMSLSLFSVILIIEKKIEEIERDEH